MKLKILSIIAGLLILSSLIITGCQNMESDERIKNQNNSSQIITNPTDTTYVELNPSWGGFNNPTAILAGNDGFLYVADTDNNKVVQINETGLVLETRGIINPIALAQDLRLDLLVSGLIYSTVINDSVPAIFRIHLYESNHHLAVARIDTVYKEPTRPNRRFTGIAMMTDNNYLVTRSGPDNSSFIDPDTRLLRFIAQTRRDTTRDGQGNIISIKDTVLDKYITPVSDIATRQGQGLTDILYPTGIATFPNSNDFILTQSSAGGTMLFGALWMVYYNIPTFEGWLPKFDVRKPEEKNRDFIKPNRFVEASAATVDGQRLDIFIIDSEQDSLVKFDRRGNYKPESFGKSYLATLGSPPLNHPKGVAYKVGPKTLYITDSGNNKIRRFRLSTDR
jgi:hypothetical protein